MNINYIGKCTLNNIKIRIIGDVHCKFHAYKEKIKDSKYSIQLGDFGYAKEWYKLIRQKIDHKRHKIIPGNHDDYYGIRYEYTFGTEGYGVNNGEWIKDFNFFWIRGAYTPPFYFDFTPGVNWWEQEQLTIDQLEKVKSLYIENKPDIILAHECPDMVSGMLFGKDKIFPNRTSNYFSQMFYVHKPKLWFFGHWHKTLIKKIDGTHFVCLNELDYVDYEIEEHIGNDINWNIVQIREQIRKLKNKDKPLIY